MVLNLSVVFFSRTLPSKVGLPKLAEKIREYNFHGLLIIGGYEVKHLIQ